MSSSLFSVIPGDGGDSEALLTNAVVGLGATTLLLLLSTTAYYYYNKSSSSAYRYNNDVKKMKNGQKSKSNNADEDYPKLDRVVSESIGLIHHLRHTLSLSLNKHSHLPTLNWNTIAR